MKNVNEIAKNKWNNFDILYNSSFTVSLVTTIRDILYNSNRLKNRRVDELLSEFNNKELIKTYFKNGFTVRTYKAQMTAKERMIKDAQIKYDIINIVKDLTNQKK